MSAVSEMRDEQRRQLEYIERELARGDREDGDIRLLELRRADILRQAKKTDAR